MHPPIRWSHAPCRLSVWLAIGRQLCWAIIFQIVLGTAAFAGALEVVRERPEAAGDTRYDHYWQLLAQALAITQPDFGPFTLRESIRPMTERRALEELETGSDNLTVLVHGNVADYEKRLLPIRFPLDKGLLGYRVFLIRGDLQSRLDLVGSLDDLQRYSIGQGR